ncbi:MAG: EamA family transporter [Candidatus Omnitrophica bacterium]|nr:EamA family transporter [Candidatus Omnitrophota bacterium]
MWLLLALLCAFLVGTGDVFSKLALRKSNEKIVGLARLLYALPILGLAAWAKGIPPLPHPFWFTLLGMLPFELSAYLLYLRSIRIAPLSLTVPFLALTPVFTIVTSWILLGERVSFAGAVGIFAVTTGIYLIQMETVSKGWTSPLVSLFREPGIRFMILSAFLYSIASNLGKRAIQFSSPVAFAFLYQLIDAFILSFLAWRGSASLGQMGKELFLQRKLYLALGAVMAFALLVHAVGISMSPVPYFIAVKRTSLLVGVVSGGLFFKEEKILQRLVGAAFMVGGVGLIAFMP